MNLKCAKDEASSDLNTLIESLEQNLKLHEIGIHEN